MGVEGGALQERMVALTGRVVGLEFLPLLPVIVLFFASLNVLCFVNETIVKKTINKQNI